MLGFVSTSHHRVRLRFRVAKKLNIDAEHEELIVRGRAARLSARAPAATIKESEWLVLNVRGFVNEDEARAFASDLKVATELASVATRLGVDTGQDLPTSQFSDEIRRRLHEEHGVLMRNDVHGVDVFEDDPGVRIFGVSATSSVLATPAAFLAGLDAHQPAGRELSQAARDVLLLLNWALLRPEPVAQIVFAVSAVEMLGQNESWSPAQKGLIAELAHAAHTLSIGTADERREVSEGIARGLHKLSLRQGVLRLLDRVNLAALRGTWDALYAERSSLVHGLAPRPGVNYADLAQRTVNLCGAILLRVLALEIPSVGREVDLYYPT